MSIGDLFRSKINHSDPEVRARAIEELEGGDVSVLADVARDDDDFKVRRLALEKIDDAETLIGLAKSAAAPIDQMAADRVGEMLARVALDGSDLDAARSAISKIATIGSTRTLSHIAANAGQLEVKRDALEAISDDRALADVVREASDEAIALGALAKISNHGAISAIAVSDPRKAIGLAALERLSETNASREVLARVESKAGHKAVRARARTMLTSSTGAADTGSAPAETPHVSQAQLAHAERVQLTHTIESLSRSQDFRRAAEFAAATRRFEELGDGDDTELAGRFRRSAARYLEGQARYEARAARLAKEGKPAEVHPGDDDESATTMGADAMAPSQAVKNGVAAGAEPSKETSTETDAPTSEQTAPSSEPSDGIAEVHAPAPVGDPATAATAATAAERVPAVSEAAKKKPERPKPKTYTPEEKRIALESISQNLESLATSNKTKTINKALARAESKFAELGDPPTSMPELLARLERARQALLIRAGEIREALEWQQWANIGKQEQLIERAAKLAADEGAGKLGERLRTLQKEWKELGPAPRDRAQELWERFKVACDSIYERVKVERKEDNEARKKSLALKLELCEQAEALSGSSDWAETAQALKQLQAKWKTIGPVPRRQSDKVWKRFRGACDAFFERRKPHLEEQLAEYRDAIEEKTSIVVEMESLITDEAKERPLRERGEYFDSLSVKFSRAGRVPPREFAAFRKRQDAVEKALKKEKAALRVAREQERAEELAQFTAEVTQIKDARVGGTLGGEELAGHVMALREKVKDAADVPKEIRRALEEEVHKAIELAPDAFKGTELDPVISKQRKEKICKKVEKLVPEKEADSASSAEDMAAKLRAALADRALGGVLSKQADPGTIKRVLSEARDSWRRLGPVPGEAGHALEQRFKGACERAQRSAK